MKSAISFFIKDIVTVGTEIPWFKRNLKYCAKCRF